MNKKTKIFIVDDEPTLRASLGEALSDLDCDVKTFASAKEALNNTSWHEQNIAFIDYKMPIINGIDLIKEIRPKAPNLIIVLITAFENEARDVLSGTDVINLQVYTILTKPIMLDRLEEVMERIIKKLEGKKFL
jgi:DNA-binding NtrC family response regulator